MLSRTMDIIKVGAVVLLVSVSQLALGNPSPVSQDIEPQVCVVSDFQRLAAIGESVDILKCKRGDILIFEKVLKQREAMKVATSRAWNYGNTVAYARVCEFETIKTFKFGMGESAMCRYSGKTLDGVNLEKIILPNKKDLP